MSELNNITVLPVPPAELIQRWKEVEPLLESAMATSIGRYIPIDILAYCIQGVAQGWFIRDDQELLGVLVTKIEVWPRRRGLSLFALAGTRMSEWLEISSEIVTDYARRMNCDHLEVQGRQGWARALGVEPYATVLIRDLSGRRDVE